MLATLCYCIVSVCFAAILSTRDTLTTIISIRQLDEHEALPVDAWLHDNSLDFSSSGSSVKTDAVDAATLTDDKVFFDVGTDTMQLEEDERALAAKAALEAQEKGLLEEQEALLRSHFDAEVSGYQMQLSEVEREAPFLPTHTVFGY